MYAPIWLKFGMHIWGLKANSKINFGVNLINTEVIISDFMHKEKLNFCQAYRVSCLKEQAENRFVGWLNVRGVPFGG